MFDRRPAATRLPPALNESALTAAGPVDGRTGPVGDRAEALAERDLVLRALGRLPSRQRAVLALRFYEDVSEAQIAEVLGCATGTVRSLTNRALSALRAQPGLSQTLDQARSISGEKP
jgi:RNA polymerase sigma factor (sigma-70 family)